MILKRKKILSIVLLILILSCSTTCFAQGQVEVSINKIESTEADEIDPRTQYWTVIESTSGRIPVPAGTYVPGASSYYVKLLQASLNTVGYNCGTADGIYGNNTKNAIINFQRNSGIAVDGIAGEFTWGTIGHLVRYNNLLVGF